MKKLLNDKNFIFLTAIFLFFFGELFQLIPIEILNLNIDTISINTTLLLKLFSSLVSVLILVLIFYDGLKKDFVEFKKNKLTLFDTSFKIWCVGLILMALFNTIINYFSPNNLANNEEAIRGYISASPYIMFINTAIMAPLVEELVFRKSFRVMFKNKFAFILISGLVFGALHVIFSIENAYDYLYLLPYCSLGLAFSYMYYKTDNIWCPITMHAIHNGIMTILNIISIGMMLW